MFMVGIPLPPACAPRGAGMSQFPRFWVVPVTRNYLWTTLPCRAVLAGVVTLKPLEQRRVHQNHVAETGTVGRVIHVSFRLVGTTRKPHRWSQPGSAATAA